MSGKERGKDSEISKQIVDADFEETDDDGPDARLVQAQSPIHSWSRGKRILAALGLIVSITVAIVVSYLIDHERKQAEAERKQRDRDLAVALLPEGIEAAWTAYVDRQFAAVFRRRGDVVRVRSDSGPGSATFVSLNMPFSVYCFGLHATVSLEMAAT